MKSKIFKALTVIFVLLFSLSCISCPGEILDSVVIDPVPQIKGVISIPEGTNLSNSSIWVKEITSNKISQVNSDGTFCIKGLIEDSLYNLYFSDSIPSTISKSTTSLLSDKALGEAKSLPIHYGAQVTNVKASSTDTSYIGTIPITRTGTITGNVTLNYNNEELEDNSGIDVYIPYTSFITKTDKSGKYFITNVPQGTYKVCFEKPNYVEQDSENIVLLEKDSSTITVQYDDVELLNETGTISGKVVMNQNGDNSGVSIRIEGVNSINSYLEVSNSDGTFSINNIQPGSYKASFFSDNYFTYIYQDIDVAPNFTTTLSNTINLIEHGGTITGIVKDITGLPCTDVQVIVTATDGKKKIINTIQDGTFTLIDLLPDTYSIELIKVGYLSETIDNVVITNLNTNNIEPIILTLMKCGISGSVFLSGETSFEGISVLLKAVDDSVQYNSITDIDGKYTFNAVKPGVYTILSSKRGYASKESPEFTIKPLIDKTVENILMKLDVRSIIGKVDLEQSVDDSGTLVTASNLSDASLIYCVSTNSFGVFKLEGLEPGEYRIVITNDANYKAQTLTTIDLNSDKTCDLGTIELLTAKGNIEGLVTLECSVDNSGIYVFLIGTSYSTLTDENGLYSFSVPIGDYSGGLRFIKSDYEMIYKTDTISVLDGATRAVESIELICNKFTIKGNINLVGCDDNSNITVSLGSKYNSTKTDINGDYTLNHIPLGNYTLSITGDNISKVEKQIEVTAGLENNIETINIISNSASILGTATFFDKNDHSNIKVTVVDAEDNIVCTSYTEASGYFRVTNMETSGAYHIRFTKDGWSTQAIEVSGLLPFEERNITSNHSIELVDTISPVLSYAIINDDENFTIDKAITIDTEVNEVGSGLKHIQVSFDENFEKLEYELDYLPKITIMLEKGNGFKTIYVRVIDNADNVSNFISDSITLNSQKVELCGILSDEELILTKSNSPYLVTDNVIIPKNKTLRIEPGVDVQFDGAYSIKILGSLDAVGTEDDVINFYGINNGIDTWKGIMCPNTTFEESGHKYNPVFISGNHLKYATLNNCDFGLSGYIFAENVSVIVNGDLEITIQSKINGTDKTNFALYKFQGVFINGYIRGNAYSNTSIFDFYNEPLYRIIKSDIFSFNFGNSGCLIGNKIDAYICNNMLSSSKIGDSVNFVTRGYDCYAYNNTIKNFEKCDITGSNNTLENIKSLTLNCSNKMNIVRNNSYINCGFSKLSDNTIKENYKYVESFSNFVDWDEIVTTTTPNKNSTIYFKNNYWGTSKTKELNKNTKLQDLDFFTDSFDNNEFSLLDYSNWSNKPYTYSGYLGNNYIGFKIVDDNVGSATDIFEVNDNILTPINPIKFKVENDGIGDNKIKQYRMVQDKSLLTNKANESKYWKDFPTNNICSYTLKNMNYESTSYLDIYIQVRDSLNNISGIQGVSRCCSSYID